VGSQRHGVSAAWGSPRHGALSAYNTLLTVNEKAGSRDVVKHLKKSEHGEDDVGVRARVTSDKK